MADAKAWRGKPISLLRGPRAQRAAGADAEKRQLPGTNLVVVASESGHQQSLA